MKESVGVKISEIFESSLAYALFNNRLNLCINAK